MSKRCCPRGTRLDGFFRLDSPLPVARCYAQLMRLGPWTRSSATATRLYNFMPQQRFALENDCFAALKEEYRQEGGGRSNRTYGYIRKRSG
jgi:hypothetical protein